MPAKSSSPQQVDVADEALRQLKRIANLLALLATKGDMQSDRIVSMAAAGFPPAEIATLLGTTANTVSVAIYQSKKRITKKAKKRK